MSAAARGGVEAVMKDSFFSGVDWKVLYRRYLLTWLCFEGVSTIES